VIVTTVGGALVTESDVIVTGGVTTATEVCVATVGASEALDTVSRRSTERGDVNSRNRDRGHIIVRLCTPTEMIRASRRFAQEQITS
jgi:hypothetical protein